MSRARRTLALVGLLATVAGVAPAGAAGPAGWRSVGKDREGELLLDPASIRRSGGKTRVTTQVVAITPPGAPPFSLLVEQEINCVRPSSATLSVTQFGAGPKPLRRRVIPAAAIERDTIYADSNLAGLYRAVCPRGPALKPPPVQPLIRVVPPPRPDR